MSIHVNEEQKLFHLQTAKTSYVFKILEMVELDNFIMAHGSQLRLLIPTLPAGKNTIAPTP